MPGLKSGVPHRAHRREGDAQLVAKTLFERLADDVPATHDHDVTMRRHGPSLIERTGQIVDEDEAHPELPFEANVRRRRVGDDEERRRPRLIRAVPPVLVELRRVAKPVLFVSAGPVTYPFSDMAMSAITFGTAAPLGDDQ